MPDRTLFAEAIVLYANPFSYISLKKSRISFRVGAEGCICLPAQNPPHLHRIELHWTLVFGLHEWSAKTLQRVPDKCTAKRTSFLCSGWKESGTRGSVRSCLWERISLGWLRSMLNSTGNHAWVVHFGTINMPVALSLLIFCNTRATNLKDGKA